MTAAICDVRFTPQKRTSKLLPIILLIGTKNASPFDVRFPPEGGLWIAVAAFLLRASMRNSEYCSVRRARFEQPFLARPFFAHTSITKLKARLDLGTLPVHWAALQSDRP